jgi:hypothetical protein
VDGLWFHAIGSRNDDEHLRTLFHGFTSGPAAQLRTTEDWNLKPEKKMLAAANFPAHTSVFAHLLHRVQFISHRKLSMNPCPERAIYCSFGFTRLWP